VRIDLKLERWKGDLCKVCKSNFKEVYIDTELNNVVVECDKGHSYGFFSEPDYLRHLQFTEPQLELIQYLVKHYDYDVVYGHDFNVALLFASKNRNIPARQIIDELKRIFNLTEKHVVHDESILYNPKGERISRVIYEHIITPELFARYNYENRSKHREKGLPILNYEYDFSLRQ
jgi:hypothetical protein